MYKVEVYSDPCSDRNKKYILGQRYGNLKLGTITIERVSLTKNIGISTTLSSYVWEVKDKKGIDPILKWEVIKNAVNIGLASKIACFAMRRS